MLLGRMERICTGTCRIGMESELKAVHEVGPCGPSFLMSVKL